MPVYNAERFIVETLNSLLDQTYADFELVISDNASTDSTAAICEEYALRDGRIRFFRANKNQGAAWNYNRVFHLARGRYFKWNAADDLCAPDVVEKCFRVLEEQSDVALSYPRTQIIDDASKIVKDYDDGLDVGFEFPRDRFRMILRRGRECNAVFGLIRSSCLGQTGLIQSYQGSDGVLLGELSLYGKFVQVPDSTFFRRDHPAASSRNRSPSDQLEFFDPQLSQEIFLRRWRRYWEYLKVVTRSPLATAEKLRCIGIVLRQMIASRDNLVQELLGAYRQLRSRRQSGR